MDLLQGITVPTWVMVLIVGLLTVSLLIGVPLARSAGKRRGRRLAHPELFQTKREKFKDTALFLAALVPSVLVWLAVMGVSFIGLTGFAADVMHWDHWTNMLVPLSLDGISVSFGAWAFVAVKRGRHPGRAYKIVLAAATMSALLNFVHGRNEWSLWAGFYLAFLSFAGMAMFHELLDQFMAAYDDETALKTRYPRFGQRWLYAPISTFAARRAWIVHPPQEGLRPSVRNALAHLEGTREARRRRRLGGAVKFQEEQRAKLVEIHSRNEVRAAKRGQGPHFTSTPLADFPDSEPLERPIPPVPAPAVSRKAATQDSPPPEVDEVFDRLRKELSPQPEPPSRAEQAEQAEPPAPRQAAAPREEREESARHRAGSATPSAVPLWAEPVTAPDSLDLLPEAKLLPLPEQMRREQPDVDPFFRGPDTRPFLGSRVREILDAHVRNGDDLNVGGLTDLALRALAAPASRDSVHSEVSAWVNEVRRGVRPYSAGPRPALPVTHHEQAGKLEFPFEVLALQPVFVNVNAVACPECGTQESLMFSGLHPRRPVEARCGCGRRWPIVGLGSSRVWEVLAGEMAAGQAQLLPA